MASIIEFLKTGRFDGLSFEMGTEEVKELLGEPEDVTDFSPPLVWKYGSLQISFDVFESDRTGGRPDWNLISVRLFFHASDVRLPDRLMLTDPRLPDLSYDGFRAYLDANAIKVVGGVTIGPGKHLVLDSAVRVTFDDEDRLYSIGSYAKHKPETKQVSVSVSWKDFETIQREAREQGLSPSKLCSQWVRAQVAKIERATEN